MDAIALYLKDKEGQLCSPNTVAAAAQDMKIFFGDKDPLKCQYPDLVELKTLRSEVCKPSTLSRNMSTVRTFYTFIDNIKTMYPELCSWKNPFIPRLGKVKVPRDNTSKALTEDELKKLEHCSSVSGLISRSEASRVATPRNLAMFYLMSRSGLRSGECSGMLLSDIDVAHSQVKIFGKGAKFRNVPLDETTMDAIFTWRDAPQRPHFESGHLFTATAAQFTPPSLCQVWKAIFKRAGVEGSPHRFRHHAAETFLALGADITHVQYLLGHSDLNTTLRYLHGGEQAMIKRFREIQPQIEAMGENQ